MKYIMKTTDLMNKKTLLSYEVFPPKPTTPVHTIYDTLEQLKDLSPDFISVTYGAGGGSHNNETFKIASTIKSYGIESVVHLPCISLTKEDVLARLDKLTRIGIHNILALRGDVPQEDYKPGDFKYASDLVSFVKEQGDFRIMGACYPEGHIEAKSKADDIRNLKTKVDAGVEHLITQLFFDNNYFYSFIEDCQAAGIQVPVEAGIMPVTNKKQIEKMTSLCGATVPKKLARIMDQYEHDPAALQDACVEYAIEQIIDLAEHGVDGIHLYTMNNPYVAKKIHQAILPFL